MKKLLIFIIVIISFSCSLKRDNPLDPNASGIVEPIRVSGMVVSPPAANHINISWDQTPECDGYIIYRSQSYYGEYAFHKEITHNETTEFDDYDYISGTHYYYMISAYKEINERKLEGLRSEKKTW